MKIKQIKSILKGSKNITVLNAAEGQWLGNGAACYPVYNLPTLTKEHIFAMFDIPEDKREKFFFTESPAPSHINFTDHDECENSIKKLKIAIDVYGYSVTLLETSRGLVCINSQLLKPFQGLQEGYELYERFSRKQGIYIAVKSGFSLIGIIMPLEIVEDGFVEELERVTELARYSVEFSKKGEGD